MNEILLLKYIVMYKDIELAQYHLDRYNEEPISLIGCDLSLLKLPKDKDFFQKIYASSIAGCIMPEMDYSEYNFEKVSISHTFFPDNCILPKNIDLFLKIKDKSLKWTRLPIGDYSNYNFKNVLVSNCKFPEGSILPKTFFKEIAHSDAQNIYIPSGNYKEHSFKNTKLSGATFHPNALLPERIDLFEETKEYGLCKLPKQTVKNIHFYSIKTVMLKLIQMTNDISPEQIFIIKQINNLDKDSVLK